MASPGASRGRHQSRDEVDDAFEVSLAFPMAPETE
jgi:hypothetical protein